MDELILKLDRLFTSYRISSSTERLNQKILQLNEFIDGKLTEEQIYHEDLLEQISNLSKQIQHFDKVLSIPPESIDLNSGSLIEIKQLLQDKYQEKQQLVVELQDEITRVVHSLHTTSKEFHSQEEHEQFIKTIQSNSTSIQQLSILNSQLTNLKYERENYEQMKTDYLQSISQLNNRLNGKTESDALTGHSLQQLKQIKQALLERETLLEEEISFLKDKIKNDLLVIEQFNEKDDLLDCLLEKERFDSHDQIEMQSLKVQIEQLQEDASRIEKIKRLRFERAFEAEYVLLIEIWNALDVLPEERDSFYLKIEKYSLEGVQSIRNEITRLTPICQLAQQIEGLIDKRDEFILRMKAFEVSASDPARLFRSSFQLNQEERFRKTAYPTLIKIEQELKEGLQKFYLQTNHHFKSNYYEKLEQEIEERSISETFFVFEDAGQNGSCTTRRTRLSGTGGGGIENVKQNGQVDNGKESAATRDKQRHLIYRKD